MKAKILPLCLLLAMAGLSAAGPAFQNVHEFGLFEGIIMDPAGPFSNTVTWTHAMPYSGDTGDIISASLTIEGTGIENIFSLDFEELDLDGPLEGMDLVTISFNNQVLGTLSSDCTTFDLDPSLLTDPFEAEAVIEFQFDWSLTDLLLPVDIVRLDRSILTVVTGGGIVPVPAPGSVLLCGIGTLLIGYLKRRERL